MFWDLLGTSLGRSWASFWRLLGLSWEVLGPSWRPRWPQEGSKRPPNGPQDRHLRKKIGFLCWNAFGGGSQALTWEPGGVPPRLPSVSLGAKIHEKSVKIEEASAAKRSEAVLSNCKENLKKTLRKHTKIIGKSIKSNVKTEEASAAKRSEAVLNNCKATSQKTFGNHPHVRENRRNTPRFFQVLGSSLH